MGRKLELGSLSFNNIIITRVRSNIIYCKFMYKNRSRCVKCVALCLAQSICLITDLAASASQ